MNKINLSQVNITDTFWSARQQLVKNVAIPYQEKILNDEIPNIEKSHALANFRIAAGLEKGDFYGMVFQDSDVAKWLEGVAYSLITHPDKALENRADHVIDIIQKAQQSDGYLNTYFIIKEPDKRWQNLQECHELYCAGHMMEAAVAYYEATGKDKLLKVMEKNADHINSIFGINKVNGIPGHQEIEIGLLRLYQVTKKKRYFDLAQYFINQRGKNPNYFINEAEKRGWDLFGAGMAKPEYSQCHKPVREQTEAVGHSVRAVYMYTAMAELAKQIQDKELLAACEALWENITETQMYITGGIGSTVDGEAFTFSFNLPNDSCYTETCAAIGLVFFAKKMLEIHSSGKYADIMELALYNGILSGMQLDGKRFFYVNPLEVNPDISGKQYGFKHVLPERPEWYACSCCPPNVVRMIMSLGQYIWDEDDTTIYSHMFIGGHASFEKADIVVSSQYPWTGNIIYTVQPKCENEFTLAIHIPEYIRNEQVSINSVVLLNTNIKNGYLYINRKWQFGDNVEVIFDLSVRRVYSDTRIRHNIGKVALMRGPFVYCFEGIDNGKNMQELQIPSNTKIKAIPSIDNTLQDMLLLEFNGRRATSHNSLYSTVKPCKKDVKMTAIPYFAWGNRGKNQMSIWMSEDV